MTGETDAWSQSSSLPFGNGNGNVYGPWSLRAH